MILLQIALKKKKTIIKISIIITITTIPIIAILEIQIIMNLAYMMIKQMKPLTNFPKLV